MAFQSENLSVLAYANGFTLWHYVTDNDIADVLGEGYFNAAREMLWAGDVVMCNAFDGARPSFVQIVVESCSGHVLKVAAVSGGKNVSAREIPMSDLIQRIHAADIYEQGDAQNHMRPSPELQGAIVDEIERLNGVIDSVNYIASKASLSDEERLVDILNLTSVSGSQEKSK